MSEFANGVRELRHVVATSWWVSLSIDGPRWPSRGDHFPTCYNIWHISVSWNPMVSWWNIDSNSGRSSRKLHHWFGAWRSESTLSSLRHVPANCGAVKELWIVNELVGDHSVHAFSWHFVVAQLDIRILVQSEWLETAIVFQNSFSLGLLRVHFYVVVSLELLLPWL